MVRFPLLRLVLPRGKINPTPSAGRYSIWVGLLIALVFASLSAAQTREHKSEDYSRLPQSFTLWGLARQFEPAAVVEPPDLSGLDSARLGLLSIDAASWTVTRYYLNGADVTDPYQPGRPMFFPDVQSVARVETAPAEHAIAVFSEAPRERWWHGSASSFFTARPLCWTNLPPKTAAPDLLRAERYRWYTRDNLQLGGPLARTAGLFASATGEWAGRDVARGPTPLNSRVLLATATAWVRPGGRHRIDAAFSGARVNLSGYGVPAGLEALTARRNAPPWMPVAGLREEDHFDSVQVHWRRDALEAHYAYAAAHLDTLLPEVERVISPALLGNLGVRSRHELAAGARIRALSFAAGWRRGAVRNRLTVPGDSHLIDAGDGRQSLVRFNTPLDSRGLADELFAEAAAPVRLWRRLSIEAGLRLDHSRGRVPPQSSPAGSFAPARRFPHSTTPIRWTSAAPRLALALGFGPAVLRGSWERSYHPLAVRYLDFANPNSLSGSVFDADSRRLLMRFGGEFSSIDGRLRRPYADAFQVGAEARLSPSLQAHLRLFRRDDKDRLAAVNTGVAFHPRSFIDPGPDFVLGTFDDQALIVYAQAPETLGLDRYLLTNPGLRSVSQGLAAEISGRTRPLDWRLAFVAERGVAAANPGNAPWENDPGIVGSLCHSPNTLIHAEGRIYFDRAYIAKFTGVWQAPRRFGALELGTIVNYFDGLPFARRLLVPGLPQGPEVVMATRRGSPEGGHRTEFLLLFDVRVARSFALRYGTLRAIADIFNVPNFNLSTLERDQSGAEFNRRLPLAIQPPRSARLGLEFRF